MTKGTTSFGKRNHNLHGTCKRCGQPSFHYKKKSCSSCGYPQNKMRRYNWSKKAKRRRTQGTGSCKHLRLIWRLRRNGFMEKQAKKLKLAH